MKALIKQIRKIADNYSSELRKIGEEDFSYKSEPSKWSKKEILGHLVDSAQNNIRRFVVSQYEDIPKVVYQQDSWVRIADYQHYPTTDLIELWMLLNKHICIILDNTSDLSAGRKSETNEPEMHTIEWLAGDYVKHLLHHIHQILSLKEVPYP